MLTPLWEGQSAGSAAHAQRPPRAVLWTAEKNPPAQALFEQLGFRRTMIEITRERRRRRSRARLLARSRPPACARTPDGSICLFHLDAHAPVDRDGLP